jgi:hypothetical protein
MQGDPGRGCEKILEKNYFRSEGLSSAGGGQQLDGWPPEKH